MSQAHENGGALGDSERARDEDAMHSTRPRHMQSKTKRSKAASPLSATAKGGSDSAILDDLPEFCITAEEDKKLGSLVAEVGRGEAGGEESVATLPVEWVVDIADKDSDWFIATAYAYNDTEQTVHVMVPDREAPTWSGDLPINPLNLRLLECCDGRSMALFKQLVRESAFEVDWNVRISRPFERKNTLGALNPGTDDSIGKALEQQDKTQETNESSTFDLDVISSSAPPGNDSKASASTTTAARAIVLLPLGNCVVVEVARATTSNGSDDVGDGGAAATNETAMERKVVRLDDRVELVNCRGVGGPEEEAFYRLAEEGVVAYDADKVNWRSYKARTRKRDRGLGSLAPTSSSAIAALVVSAMGSSDENGMELVLREVGVQMRSLARRTLELRDDLLTEHLVTLRRVRRFVLDGNLDDGAALMEQANEAFLGSLEERHTCDKERTMLDASALEELLVTIAHNNQRKPQRGERSTVIEGQQGAVAMKGGDKHRTEGGNTATQDWDGRDKPSALKANDEIPLPGGIHHPQDPEKDPRKIIGGGIADTDDGSSCGEVGGAGVDVESLGRHHEAIPVSRGSELSTQPSAASGL